jgi:hypothetical protein
MRQDRVNTHRQNIHHRGEQPSKGTPSHADFLARNACTQAGSGEALRRIKGRKIVTDDLGVRVIGAEHLFSHLERPLVQ